MCDASANYGKLGLSLALDFITAEEEQALLAQIRGDNPTQKRKVTLRNTIQRYGSREPYFDNIVSSTIPAYLGVLCDRLVDTGLLSERADSVTINEYYEGQTISPHIDHVNAGPVITILSLGAPAIMVFAKDKERFEVELPPRSITQMRKQIRYGWTHEIKPVPALRYSLVFRNSAVCRQNLP